MVCQLGDKDTWVVFSAGCEQGLRGRQPVQWVSLREFLGTGAKEAVWANPAPGFWCGGGHKERGVCLQPQSHSFVGRGPPRRMAGD